MYKDFNSEILDLFLHNNYETLNEKYCHQLVQQFNFITSLKLEIVEAMRGTGRKSGLPIYIFIQHGPANMLQIVNPALTDVQKRNLQIEIPVTIAQDPTPGDQLVTIRNSVATR